jgi:hypothetical protein
LDEIGLAVYEEMSFKVIVYGRRTDGQMGDGRPDRWADRWATDGRRTKSDHKSLPCHFLTGELKKTLFSCQFKGGNSDNFCARVKTLSHMMWLMTRNLCFKFEIKTLRNKELIVKKP